MMKTSAEIYHMIHQDPDGLVAYVLFIQERNKTLEDSAALNSRNSSKPPSSEGYAKPAPKSLRIKSGKKSGGQPGHPGTTLKQVEKPDKTVTHPLVICPCGCGSDLRALPALEQNHEARQVFDLPTQKLEVTEHRVETKRCPVSGKLVQAPWPVGVTAHVQYGPDYSAWLVYLYNQQHLPLNRIDQMSFDLYGQHVSEETIISAIKALDQELVPFEVAIKEQILMEPVVGADETGLRVLAELYWLHLLSTPTRTWYGVHKKRGKEALDYFAILEFYQGRLVHDCWDTYFKLTCCLHALCNAHILRELVFAHEVNHQAWAKVLFDLLIDMNHKRNEQMQVAAYFPEECLLAWHQKYQEILGEGQKANPPLIPEPDAPKKRGRKKQTKTQNLLDRLVLHEQSVLAFLHDFRIPFTNNQSEQDGRMMKVKQKVSGCFRTLEGAERFARIRSYISTVRKQGRSIFEELKAAMRGNPFIPEAPSTG